MNDSVNIYIYIYIYIYIIFQVNTVNGFNYRLKHSGYSLIGINGLVNATMYTSRPAGVHKHTEDVQLGLIYIYIYLYFMKVPKFSGSCSLSRLGSLSIC